MSGQATTVLPTTGTISGLTMTQDTNAALAALVGKNGGAAAPANAGAAGNTTEAWMDWADTVNRLLKIRNSDNTAWVVVGDPGAGASSSWVPYSQGQALSPFVRKNRLINGEMKVDQRNAGAAQTFTAAAAAAYCIDRWYGYCTGANVTGQQVAGSNQSQNRYQFTGAASVTGVFFGQRIEKINCFDLNSQTATLSVDLANSLLTTVSWAAYYATADDNWTSRTLIANGSFTVTSSVARYKTSISIPAGATTGINIEFSVGAQTSGTWTIGDAQLELGTTATPIERVEWSALLRACQRYYEKSFPYATKPAAATNGLAYNTGYGCPSNAFRQGVSFKAEKRATPTLTLWGGSGSGFYNYYDGVWHGNGSTYAVSPTLSSSGFYWGPSATSMTEASASYEAVAEL